MPKPLPKSLQDYLSKIKKKQKNSHINFRSRILSSSGGILRGCKHPKTPSLAFDSNSKEAASNDAAATLADIDRFLFENFRSLYLNADEEEIKKCDKDDHEGKTCEVSFEFPGFVDPPSSLCGAHRFFVGPSSSSSLVKESRTSATTAEDTNSTSTITAISDVAKQVTGPDDFIAVFTYSPSPYDDFKHSMEGMIAARMHQNGKVDWEFMEELLFCYMDLNDKKSYKHILSAFVDLIVVLRENSSKVPMRSRRNRLVGDRRK
ncbi:Transcription repressor like [Actinidia chinensis var. chinensis]|uniref:Transcription repressor n=1 Tax=Actinidia chinensis var. chinensis TaxID=1590841 RepID=A0A2R6PSU2_ACTCC|nr:Transcription repressor like [Actinidia chinensis var. chinensis]